MLKSILVLSLLVAGSANAAQVFGLGPESGITSAVVQRQDCVRADQVLIEKTCDSYNCFPTYIYRCDGLTVGWVNKIANGADLSHTRDGGYEITTDATQKPGSALRTTVIETCGVDRDDLGQDARVSPSHDEALNNRKLAYIRKHHLNFRIQLFYNEWVMSGKCIGEIEILR